MKALIKLILMGLTVMISAYVIPGVTVDSFFTALVAAVILAIVNFIIKPIVSFLTLPINILTLGLFTFIINAGMVMLVSSMVPGFFVSGWFSALFFSVVLSIVRGFLDMVSD